MLRPLCFAKWDKIFYFSGQQWPLKAAARWHAVSIGQLALNATALISAANSACTWRGAQGLAFANDQRSLAFPFSDLGKQAT